MKTILLLRHGPVDYMDGRKCCLGSRTDPPLTPAGRAAAAALAPMLRARGVQAVWSSPLLRCRETAEAMAAGLPTGCVPGLEEQDCGAWDGLSFDEIRARFPAEYARRGLDPALPPPGGEPPDQCAARGLAALRRLAEQAEGNLAVVAHAGINRAMLCRLTERPMSEMRTLPQPYLGVSLLRFDGTGWIVDAVGCSTEGGRIVPSAQIAKEEPSYETTV